MHRVFLALLLISIGARFLYKAVQVEEQLKTYENFYVRNGGKFPAIFRAQMILETNRLKSNIYLENHNLIGMKCAQIRSTYCKGTNRGHAVFTNSFYSIREYIFYVNLYLPIYEEKKRIKVDSNEEYFDFLIWVKYAEDKDYISKLQNYL